MFITVCENSPEHAVPLEFKTDILQTRQSGGGHPSTALRIGSEMAST